MTLSPDHKVVMTLVDIHTHLPGNRNAVLSVNPADFSPEPGQFYSVGWHPWELPPLDAAHLDILANAAHHPQVIALGETGLDSLRGGSMQLQQQWLEAHISLAEDVGKPLVVHLVRSAATLITLWRKTQPHHVPLVVHGMRSNAHVARMLLDEGFYLSFGWRFNPAALLITPEERLLIETDDDPTHSIHSVAAIVAAARNTHQEDITNTAAVNVKRLLRDASKVMQGF